MVFVGDVALGNHPKTPGFGFFSRYREGIPLEMAARIIPPGVSCDLLFGNLEFALTADRRLLDTNKCCIGHVAYAEFLRMAGFTVLNLANNHAWQYGRKVFGETVRALREVGIKVVGIPDDYAPGQYLKVAGQTVAFLGISDRPRQGFREVPDYNEFDEADILVRIRDARGVADLVCVSVHWGHEFIEAPSQSERRFARAMIDAGADVVVGHHPHVLREIECYRGGVIAYSLGNFIGDMTWNPATRRSGCLQVRPSGSGSTLYEFLPAVIGEDFFPCFLQKGERGEYFQRQHQSFEQAGTDAQRLGYDVLAQQELRRHQLLTLKFLVRNISKYRLSTLSSILSHAVTVRLRRKDC
jgi:poly-gamma-glutamate synthesis protein (capsule biosynthesis protein)